MTTVQQHHSVASHIVPTQEERVIDALLDAWDKDVLRMSRDEITEATDLTRQQVTRVISKLKKNEVIVETPLSDIPFHNAYSLSNEKLIEYRPNGKDNYRKKPRLRLTIEQQETFARTTAEILVNRPGCDFWDAAQEAQQVLPEDRRRSFEKLKAPNVKKWLTPMVERQKEQLKQSNEVVESVPAVEESVPEETVLNVADVSLTALVEEIGRRISLQIADEVTERVRSALSRDLQNALLKLEAEHEHKPKPEPTTTPTERLSKPKVLIVGLLNQQQQDISREFGEFMDLRFAKNEKNSVNPKLPSMASDVDAAIVMTKFISHPEEGLVRKTAKNFIRVPGGVSSLKSSLHEFYNDWSL